MNHQLNPTHRFVSLTGCACLLFAGLATRADDFERGGKWFVTTGGQYLTSESTEFEDGGIRGEVSLDSVYLGGLGIGYDLSNHFTLGVNVQGGGGTIEASAGSASVSESATFLAAGTYLDWNILKSRLTPLVSANLGFLGLSGDVGDESASETDFTFGVGGGLRWDMSDRWFAKALYTANWMEFEGFDELTLVHGFSLFLGYRF